MDLNLNNIPRHIAIIMDGNGRWAKSRGVPVTEGHIKGAEVAIDIVKFTSTLPVEYLTLFAFSTENWQRPPEEVNALMQILEFFFRRELENLNESNIKILHMGSLDNLSQNVIDILKHTQEVTANNTGLTVNIAFNYSGRQEIVDAINKLLTSDPLPSKITTEDFKKYLYLPDVPDPDLLIRTSGEQRISNFMLWQVAYTEFVFLNVLWPDFTKDHLIEAIKEYQKRQRRFGKRL